jgi:hypothetical protein
MSIDLRHELSLIASALRQAGIEYALCGGVAVAIHGYPRATQDLDLLVREDDLERIRARLTQLGYTLAAGIIPFDIGKQTERRVYRVSKALKHDLLTVDLILVAPFLEEVWADREVYRIGDQEIQVVSLNGLKKMKQIAGRPQDLADLRHLDLGEQNETRNDR